MAHVSHFPAEIPTECIRELISMIADGSAMTEPGHAADHAYGSQGSAYGGSSGNYSRVIVRQRVVVRAYGSHGG